MPQRPPFPKICIALGFPQVDTLLEHARSEYDEGERFFEFRLDYLPNPQHGVAAIRKFLSRHGDCVILATCRRHQNMGHFNGSIEEQVRVLGGAIEAGAQAIDVEIETAENSVPRMDAMRGHAYVFVSYHNFGGTPSLDPVMRRMLRVPADGYKIVTTAKKPSDNCKVLDLARSHPKTHTVVLAMGEQGFPTRVLSPGFGGVYTYAAPNAAEGTDRKSVV